MNVSEVRKIVGRIKTSLFKNSNSHSIGMLKSHFKGTGLQFKEHQIYTHGDDVRFIDWKILAKTGNPYVKTFEEERNVEIAVVIDCAPTMFHGYKGKAKVEAAIEITCLLYLLAKETKDYVHVVILADEILSLPKKAGEEGIVYLISALEKLEVLKSDGSLNYRYSRKKETDPKERHKVLMKYIGRRKQVVILSDFNDFLDKDVIKGIVYKSHVHAFRVVGPLDEATTTPYMVYAQEGIETNNGVLSKIIVEKNENLNEILGKRVKRLNVKERYLEQFIEEML